MQSGRLPATVGVFAAELPALELYLYTRDRHVWDLRFVLSSIQTRSTLDRYKI